MWEREGIRRTIVVTGATGAIGRPLCAALITDGYDIVVLSRDVAGARRQVPGAAEYRAWTPQRPGDWAEVLDGAYGVVHLAGAPVFDRRWTRTYQTLIYTSRVLSSRALVQAMTWAQTPPRVFVSTSGVGYYGYRLDDQVLDEAAEPGTDFLARVCVDWERAALRAAAHGIRTVVLRTGIVFDNQAGPLREMLLPFRFYVGGPIMPGRQWVPWIHIADQIGLIRWALEHPQAMGPINAVAPEPRRQRETSAEIGRVLGSPAWFPVPCGLLHLLFGKRAEILCTGQRAVPARALELGYTFQYPRLEQALEHLLARRRSKRRPV
jgi:uncharacterized protein